MAGPAPIETQDRPVKTSNEINGNKILHFPTSPEQIHHETASEITVNLGAAGHPTTTEDVKNNQPFQPTPKLKELGVEPSEIDLSPENMVRLVTEEFENADSGSHRVVAGKGESGVGMNKGRQDKMRSLLNKLGLKKAA